MTPRELTEEQQTAVEARERRKAEISPIEKIHQGACEATPMAEAHIKKRMLIKIVESATQIYKELGEEAPQAQSLCRFIIENQQNYTDLMQHVSGVPGKTKDGGWTLKQQLTFIKAHEHIWQTLAGYVNNFKGELDRLATSSDTTPLNQPYNSFPASTTFWFIKDEKRIEGKKVSYVIVDAAKMKSSATQLQDLGHFSATGLGLRAGMRLQGSSLAELTTSSQAFSPLEESVTEWTVGWANELQDKAMSSRPPTGDSGVEMPEEPSAGPKKG